MLLAVSQTRGRFTECRPRFTGAWEFRFFESIREAKMRHLTRGAVLAALVLVVLVCGPASVRGGKGDKNPSPVKWDYDVVDQDDKPVEKGSFVARGFAIYNGFGRRVGTYEDVSPTEVAMTMTEGKLKGKVALRRETPTALTWKGELERGSGLTYKITVVFEKYK